MFQNISRISKGIGPAEDCLDLGYQYVHVKRLGNKIICSTAHGHDHVHIVGCGGDKDHRHLGNFSDFLTPVEAVIKGKFQIQKNKLRIFPRKFLQYIGKILSQKNFISPGTEMFFQKIRDCFVIFYNKNAILHSCSSFLCLRFFHSIRIYQAVQNLEAIITENTLCNQKILTVHDRYRDFQASVEEGVDVVKVYVAVAHDT